MSSFVRQVVLFSIGLVVIKACQPPDCDRPDLGTCGNACCSLDITFKGATTESTYNAFTTGLKYGGDDGRYTYMGGDDLRQYHTKADFILQGWHSTKEHHYNDTLDFTFSPVADSCVVRAFSISQIAGAYGDSGQNYKNLIGFIKFLGMTYSEKQVMGCPPANSTFN